MLSVFYSSQRLNADKGEEVKKSQNVKYTRFLLNGLRIYGLFGDLVNFWVVPISQSLVKFLNIRSNSGQFWLYDQLLAGPNVDHISGTEYTSYVDGPLPK